MENNYVYVTPPHQQPLANPPGHQAHGHQAHGHQAHGQNDPLRRVLFRESTPCAQPVRSLQQASGTSRELQF